MAVTDGQPISAGNLRSMVEGGGFAAVEELYVGLETTVSIPGLLDFAVAFVSAVINQNGSDSNFMFTIFPGKRLSQDVEMGSCKAELSYLGGTMISVSSSGGSNLPSRITRVVGIRSGGGSL